MDILHKIGEFFVWVVEVGNAYVWGFPSQLPILIVLLLGSGIFVTFRFVFIQFRQFRHAIDVTRGVYDNPEDAGDINHFQALTTALSATVGIGNIAGVATAIHYGGPGALFWMWMSAIFGMTLKFAECTLSMAYRTFDEGGRASGGPMYYIERGLGSRWKWLAVFFAGCAIISSFGGGNMNQANTVAVSAAQDLHAPAWIVGVILAALVAIVILGGITRIGKVTSKLAPLMAVIYSLGGLFIILLNVDRLPTALAEIVTSAFSPRASLGGTAAGTFSLTLLWGIKRGLFSNEAGQGSAPIAHAAAKTKEPVREGVVAMLGPFIDTLTICTLTGLAIVMTGVWKDKQSVIRPLEPGQLLAVAADATEGELALQAQAEDFPPFVGEIAVVSGVIETVRPGGRPAGALDAPRPGVILWKNDGLVEDLRLLRDGRLFTGTLAVEEDALTPSPPGTLEFQGRILQNSSALTSWAFQRGLSRLGPWGNWIVTLSVFLFALSTVISWSYYGDRCVEYLFGFKYVRVYKWVYVAFVFLGANLALETVWAYGDLALGLMTLPNLLAILLLHRKVGELTTDYFSREHKRFK